MRTRRQLGEGSYFIEWWEDGKRHCELAGANAQNAADRTRIEQAPKLTATRNGIKINGNWRHARALFDSVLTN